LSTYLDSSFLVSLYNTDVNSTAAALALQNSLVFWVTTFAELEVVNALYLQLFRKVDSAAEISEALDAFDDDLRSGRFRVRPLPEFVFQRARKLSLEFTARLGVRGSDILHIAAALELGAERFFSFDRQQRSLAESVGLKLNP
jgi:predicted nucleic acid-binding protein